MSVKKIIEEKAMLRDHYRKMRSKMTAHYKRDLDMEIASRLLCSQQYIDASLILVYVAMDKEIETRGIIHAALANNKKVAVPRCEQDGAMSFYFITSLDQLKKSSFGILEPDPAECRKVTDFSDSLCITPGLSFDPSGNRLGFGRGYYDRFLQDFKGVSIGLCYSSFIKWDIPKESHDIPVQVIVTDRYLRRTAEK